MASLLQQARSWGELRHPKASPEKHVAFANGVQYAVMRASGGFGRPSVRELAVTRALNNSEQMFMAADAACEFVEPIVYGPLTDLHRLVWDQQKNITVDNDPEDERQLNLHRAN